MKANPPRRGLVNPRDIDVESVRTLIRLIDMHVSSILSKHSVRTLEELEEKIRRGELPEHPAWEDLIVVENLTLYRRELESVHGIED